MKITEFQEILRNKKMDLAVFCNIGMDSNPNLFYFSAYKGAGALIIPSKKKPFLAAPEMELGRAKKSYIKKVYSMNKKRFFESVYEILKKNGIKSNKVAIDGNNFTFNSSKHFKKKFKKSKITDVSMDCLKLREIKAEQEASYLKKSCKFADKILQKAIKNFKSFRTESEAAAFLEYETKKVGLELSFSPIVASGSNASMPHHEPNNKKIKNGFCVIDFGVKYRGYCSDITRTIYVGKLSKKEKNIYDKLLAIQKNAINIAENNKKCSELYDFVNEKLGNHKKYFTHGLGHGVGVEIHELPNLTLNSKDKIRDNMVFTIEPGIYIPKKFGIRIEDTVLFKNRPIPLTKTSKDLITI